MDGNSYTYINSVAFVDNTCFRKSESNRTLSENYSYSSSDFNLDERLNSIDLDGNSFGKECTDYHNILSWKIDSYSADAFVENLDEKSTNIILKCDCVPCILSESSPSTFSSHTSTDDTIISSQSNVSPNNITTKTNDATPPKQNQSSPLNILSHITEFINKKIKSPNNSPTTPFKSTTCLILNDRPSGLPAKSPEEMSRHQKEYNRLLNSIKNKERRQNDSEKAKQQLKINIEERQIQLTEIWRNFIIPNLCQGRTSKFIKHIWWEGIPTSLRDQVWKICIPNHLKLSKMHYENFLSQMQERIERYIEIQKNEIDSTNTERNVRIRNGCKRQISEGRSSAYDLYISETASIHNQRASSNSLSTYAKMSSNKGDVSETERRQILLNTIKLDVSRTFPHLNLFQEGGPHYDLLYKLLGAYTCYRPDIGYVQGMSFLAAVLILVMDVDDAFISFANIIEMPCHYAFYGLDENEFTVYLELFRTLILTHLPQLGQHFIKHNLDVNIFLCDWLFTIYSRALSLETSLVVWDMFCRDGETALFRTGLGILRCYEMQLLNSDFDEMATFLTGQMPESLTSVILVEEMREINLSKLKLALTLEDVRSRTLIKK